MPMFALGPALALLCAVTLQPVVKPSDTIAPPPKTHVQSRRFGAAATGTVGAIDDVSGPSPTARPSLALPPAVAAADVRRRRGARG